jgi:hypothetical protein
MFASMLNASIPYMSPEDQRTAASTLARMFKQFKGYNPETQTGFGAIPVDMTDDLRNQYDSQSRAMGLMDTLTKMQKASGGKEKQWGPGYQWLRQLGDVMGDWGLTGATNSLTATEMQQRAAALDPLLAEGQGSGSKVSPYSEIARMLTQPFFSAGQLMPRTQGANGQMAFGQPNYTLF